MDIEDNISSRQDCSSYQRGLIDTLPLLEAEDIADYISSGNLSESHLDKAQSIISNRYSYFGWKDYLYCYVNMVQDIQQLIESICDYVNNSNSNKPLELFFYLFLGHSLLTTTGTKPGSYQWRYFCKGVWIVIDSSQVCNMINSRIEASGIAPLLGMTSRDISHSVRELTRSMTHSNGLLSKLFHPSFKDMCDPKESTFAMPSCTYDMEYETVRLGLPADLSTRRGEVDPDIDEWTKGRSKMFKVFKTWMSQDDVVNTYLNILSGALSEFKPRYAVVNSGTGSDGKSTFFHILQTLWGGYCAVSPSNGPSTDTSSANDATPLANRLMGSRLCLTGDAGDVARLLSSPGFKSMSGGDSIYRRALHNEASDHTPPLKMLCIVNTNQTSIVVPQVAELTRIKVFLWLHKTITDEDKAVIPLHRLRSFSKGVFNYERKFIEQYGGCLMVELIKRHSSIHKGSSIRICDLVKQWTLACVGPKTILSFLRQCTQKERHEESSNQLILSGTEDSITEPTVEELFVTYMNWRRKGVRLSPSDPNSLIAFKTHLEFYHPISTRVAIDGEEEEYIESLYLRPETQILSYRSSMGMNPLLGTILTNSTANRIMGSFTNAIAEEID